jgi:hypothetical protein
MLDKRTKRVKALAKHKVKPTEIILNKVKAGPKKGQEKLKELRVGDIQ